MASDLDGKKKGGREDNEGNGPPGPVCVVVVGEASLEHPKRTRRKMARVESRWSDEEMR